MPSATPLEVFEDNIADAKRLLMLTRMLVNTRSYRMRRELRERVGGAMRVPRRDWEQLDCVESDDLFLVLMPNGEASRDIFTEPELRPLLRQSIVAVCAAIESFVSEKACARMGDALKQPGGALNRLPVSFRDVLMASEYERHGWAHRKLLRKQLEQMASAKPNRIGDVMEIVGHRDRQLWKKVDARRGAAAGDSCKQLEALVERRNLIAHTGDRAGGGKRQLRVREVDRHVTNACQIVEALDFVLPW